MTDKPEITVDESAVERVADLRNRKVMEQLHLRVTVEGGGCSGFQYELKLDEHFHEDDIFFAETVVTDPTSLPFLIGSTISFEEALVGSEFKIDNPNAVAGCGCGTSFAV